MIFVDTTKSATAGHRSGLVRVTTRLVAELGHTAEPRDDWASVPARASASDWFFTGELFSEHERPGFAAFIEARSCRSAALFHDAIPLKLPHITWPQSVARHPAYMKLLARFERVFAVSHASKAELEGFWRWAGVGPTPPVEVLPLGADFSGKARGSGRRLAGHLRSADRAKLLCVGIIEPRKNQALALEAAERVWSKGEDFELHFAGRVNPHFGRPIVRCIKAAARRWPGRVFWHEAPGDEKLRQLYEAARATLFPTIAEGCGLPLLESLWTGVPCVCSDLPSLRENAEGGGCAVVPVNDLDAWTAALREIINDEQYVSRLRDEATGRRLPTWRDTATALRAALRQ